MVPAPVLEGWLRVLLAHRVWQVLLELQVESPRGGV